MLVKTNTREDIEKAAKMAHAMDFIQKLDNGLDTEIGENGVLLSGWSASTYCHCKALAIAWCAPILVD